MPRSDRRKWISSIGMTSSRWKPLRPPSRSAKVTSAHSMPAAARTQSSTGRKPANIASPCRTAARSNVGSTATIQSAIKMPVADVDHGSVAATPTASQSTTPKPARAINAGQRGKAGHAKRHRRSAFSTGLLGRAAGSADSARAADQTRRRVSRHQADKDDGATAFLNQFAADDLIDSVIGAFDQHRRTHAFDQLKRRILLKNHHQIDRLEGGKHLGPALSGIDRSAFSLQPRRRSIAVETNNEAIASRARFGEQFDMTAMQEIEASVGEPDAQTMPPPFGDPLIEHSTSRI